MSKISVIIPTLNEENTIEKVIYDFRKELPKADMVVIDGNSSDRTRELAKKAGAKVFRQHGRGKGNALKEAFSLVDADIYLTVDGDDTYPADECHRLIEPILKEEADMVVGSRLRRIKDKRALRELHVWGNKFFCWIIGMLFKKKVEDALSGYRAITKHIVKNLFLTARGFEIETELTIKSLIEGYRIKEVPITYRARPENSISKLSTFGDGYIILYTIFSIFGNYRPFTFFSSISAFFFTIGFGLGIIVINEYLVTGYVRRFPTAILSALLIFIAVQLFSIGIIITFINTRLAEK